MEAARLRQETHSLTEAQLRSRLRDLTGEHRWIMVRMVTVREELQLRLIQNALIDARRIPLKGHGIP